MPVVISFTVETDGRLPTGQTLKEAVETVDAETNAAAAYYMINCAHPTHFRAGAQGERDMDQARARRASQCVKAQPRRA